jgi:aminoglycoside/choline kinase family phosphotransferase
VGEDLSRGEGLDSSAVSCATATPHAPASKATHIQQQQRAIGDRLEEATGLLKCRRLVYSTMHNPPAGDSIGDARLDELSRWLTTVLPASAVAIERASEDASFRRYFRVTLERSVAVPDRSDSAATLIAMDAPPGREDCRPFVSVANLLRDARVHAPAVLAADFEHGFLLLTDLGTRMYLDALNADRAPVLYGDACAALVRWQSISRKGVLPPYDRALLRRELDLFPEWYVAKHLGVSLDAAQKATLEDVFGRILENNLGQPAVFVHRDYHSRNLMVTEPNPGVLDFQDAVYGPITYDLVSLLRDAYIEWDEERQIDWAVRYWHDARNAGVPVHGDFADFWRDFEWMGVQRQIKVLGIFARLWHRDGKDGYLKDMPRVMRYLRNACARYRELAPLARLLDALEDRRPVAGYTF